MSEASSSHRLALVTGASGGIGSGIALALAGEGYSLLVQYRREHDRIAKIARTCASAGVPCLPVQADLSEMKGVEVLRAATSRLVDAGQSLSLVVNNAAALLSPDFGETKPEDFDRFFAVNVRAPFFLVQALFPLMPRGSAVVNITSASAHFSSPGDITYAMSKTALEAFTVHAAESLAARGIRINNVVPGFTDNGYELFRSEKARAYMDSFSILGGVAEPKDVAHAVIFLASDSAGRITGTSLDVTGGSTLGARRELKHSVRDYL